MHFPNVNKDKIPSQFHLNVNVSQLCQRFVVFVALRIPSGMTKFVVWRISHLVDRTLVRYRLLSRAYELSQCFGVSIQTNTSDAHQTTWKWLVPQFDNSTVGFIFIDAQHNKTKKILLFASFEMRQNKNNNLQIISLCFTHFHFSCFNFTSCSLSFRS